MTREGAAPERPGPTRPFTESEEKLLRSAGRSRTWPAGAGLFLQGDAPDSLVLVTEGRVKITADARRGYNQSALAARPRRTRRRDGLPGPSDPLGHRRHRHAGPRHRHHVGTLPRPVGAGSRPGALRPPQHRRPAASRRRSACRPGRPVSGHPGRPGVLDLALRHGTEVGAEEHACVVPVSQADLAGAAGASRESVVRALRELQRDGVVTTSRGPASSSTTCGVWAAGRASDSTLLPCTPDDVEGKARGGFHGLSDRSPGARTATERRLARRDLDKGTRRAGRDGPVA